MKKESPVLQDAKEFVFNLMREKLTPDHLYHDYNHTKEVAESAEEIANGCDLSKEDTEIVLLGAWFHDTGFTEIYDGHEEASKRIAEEFLSGHGYPADKIARVKDCIDATKYPQHPHNMPEYVLCDADLAGLAGKKYFEKARFLREEMELVKGLSHSDLEWVQAEMDFLSHHKYHTPYAQVEMVKKKNAHLLELKERMMKMKEQDKKGGSKDQQKALEKEEKEKRPERGVETVFRVTYSNHMNLSKMADDKANFLLSINGIIISFAIGGVISKLDVATNQFLLAPTALLMAVCLTSIIFAILSTRPKVTGGKFSKEDVHHKKANLLFFGNFFRMKLEDFTWGFDEMMKDREFLYGSLVRDLFFLGKVLGRKYRLIRIAYTVFMYGIILSVISYGLSYWYYFEYLSVALRTTPK